MAKTVLMRTAAAGIHRVRIRIDGPLRKRSPPKNHLQPQVVVVVEVEGCLGHNLLSLDQIFYIISDAILKIKAIYSVVDLVVHNDGQAAGKKGLGLGLLFDHFGIENDIFEDVSIWSEHHCCATF